MTHPAPVDLPPMPEPKTYPAWDFSGATEVVSQADAKAYAAEYARAAVLAEREKVEQDAKRYRWLRAQHWSDSALCVVADPKDAVKLGHDCPSHELLDEAIDTAIRALKGKT